MMNFVQVKFETLNQTILCSYEKLNLKNNLTVIVDTPEYGFLFGKVVLIYNGNREYASNSLYKVIRVATKKDYLQYLSNINDSKNALLECKKMVSLYKLNMTILDANYNFDRSQLLFRFVADERVDFRKLARDLGSFFKTRIELRQIGIRDKAKEVGGIGPCGRSLCCSTFLTSFDSVSINMAKNQFLSLNPTKINGVCGRLLCCLKYENDMYSDLKKEMPVVGSELKVFNEIGKVVSINPILNSYKVMFADKHIVEVDNNGSKE